VFPVRYELAFYIPEDILHCHRRGNLRSYKVRFRPQNGAKGFVCLLDGAVKLLCKTAWRQNSRNAFGRCGQQLFLASDYILHRNKTLTQPFFFYHLIICYLSSILSSWLQAQRSRVPFQGVPNFLVAVGPVRAPLSLVRLNEELFEKNISGSVLEN
jgi:hypothetical protein